MRSPRIPDPSIDPNAVIAPTAVIQGQVAIGPLTIVLFGAVVRAELDRVTVGGQTNIQDNAVLHCDEDVPCEIGDRVTVGHAAVVHGAAIGDRCLIGIGAKTLNRSSMGEGSWLASGSVLTEGKEIPPWTLAMGIPARPVRDLTEEEITRADEGVEHYLEVAEAYREMFRNRT